MKKHLSSRFVVRSSVVAAAVLVSVVTPVTVAGTAAAQPVGSFAAAESAAPRIDSVKLVGSFSFGKRVRIAAKITNPSDTAISGDQQTLVTFAHGKHVDAALQIIPADSAQIVLEQSTADGIKRIPLGAADDGSLQGLALIGKGLPIAPGATITENFYLTVSPSVPAEVGMGEFSLGSDAEPTGRRTTGFAMKSPRDTTADKVTVTGLNGTPKLVPGGKPVEFGVTVTKGSDTDGTNVDLFFVSTATLDLDPQHVTVERRTPAGTWVPVATGKQDQSVTGNLDKGALEAGESRTYALRLALTPHFSNGAKKGTFGVGSGEASASFDFDVRHQGGSAVDPDVNRELVIDVEGVQGVTTLKAGGSAKEFTADIINKGNISQVPHIVVEIADQDAKRRMAAGEIRVEQYSSTAKTWAPAGLRPSKEGGHLMASVTPGLPTLAPGAKATYKLRVAATSAMKAKAFNVDIEARAELSSTRERLAFGVGSTSRQQAGSAAPASLTHDGQTPSGEMAKTGGGDSTPLMVGAAGVLVAIGAGGLLIARRRAL